MKKKTKQITMTHVARYANVSQSTVSRVLNNSDFVDAKTRKAVNDAIRELGYSRKIQEDRTIGLFMCPLAEQNSPLSLDFFTELLNGIREYLNYHDCKLEIYTLPFGAKKIPYCIDESSLSGVILVTEPDIELVRHFKDAEIPCVISAADVYTGPQIVDMVFTDNIRIGKMSARYFIERGIRDFMIIQPRIFNERSQGAKLEALEHGFSIPEENIVLVQDTDASSYCQAFYDILKRPVLPRGMIIPEYSAALMMKTLLECQNYRIPEDVEIFSISCQKSQNLFPALKMNPRDLGIISAMAVVQRINFPTSGVCIFQVPTTEITPPVQRKQSDISGERE